MEGGMSPLAVELTNPIYSDLSDEEAAAIIDAKRLAIRSLVPTWKVKQTAIEGGYYAALVIASQDTVIPVEARGLAISVLAWIDHPAIQNVDMDLPAVAAMRAMLVAASICTQPQADALSALADTQIPWSESVGIAGPIGAGLVHNARLEIANNA
jgi:hypothetical protein